MTLEEMRKRKKELGYTNKMLAEIAGVPLGTVQKVLGGITKAPRHDTLTALEKILKPEGKKTEHSPSKASLVREAQAAYGSCHAGEAEEKKKYTEEDYYALPEDRRVELIDGVFYDMAAPTQIHQALLGQLYLQFAACVEGHPECELFFAPLDVRLDNDVYTMVQPDLLIVCNRTDMDIRRINGAPDFVIEILSPSNRSHDLVRKLAKYENAGVREYWIVDPENQRVIVYNLEQDEFPVIYTFHDKVPVRISGGECSIDFDVIFKKMKRYYDDARVKSLNTRQDSLAGG